MISHHYRCIFVHIPKTAGNSINRVFSVDWQDHKDLARYAIEQPPDIFAGYFKFAIVRNPWDRLFSDYNYQLKKSRAKNSKLFLFDARGEKRNFAAWVEAALAQPDLYAAGSWGGSVSPHIHRWSPQLDWLSVRGEAAVDFVARMENLGEDFPAICNRVGLPARRLPHRNRRLHFHYSHYYDRTTRDVVAAYYARDIAAFGYDFEDRAIRLRRFIRRSCAAAETRPVSHAPGGLLAAMRLPESPIDTRTASLAGVARLRPPLVRRASTWVTAAVVAAGGLFSSSLQWTSGLAAARADDAVLPAPLARLLTPMTPSSPRYPPRPITINSPIDLVLGSLPPPSTFLWQVWPGMLPGDSLIPVQNDLLSPATAGRPAAPASYSSQRGNLTPPREWLALQPRRIW